MRVVIGWGWIHSQREIYALAFRQVRGGQSAPLTSLDSQLPLAQNNPVPKWHILRWHILDPFTGWRILRVANTRAGETQMLA